MGYTILITVVPREHYLPKRMLNSLMNHCTNVIGYLMTLNLHPGSWAGSIYRLAYVQKMSTARKPFAPGRICMAVTYGRSTKAVPYGRSICNLLRNHYV